jgi:hypothetical protein
MDEQDSRNSDELLAILVAVGKPFAEAAKLAGCETAAVRRRMDDPDFRRQVSAIRNRIVATVVGRLTEASVEAVDALKAMLRSYRPADRRNAAAAILDYLAKFRTETELEERIAALEEANNTRRAEPNRAKSWARKS